MRRFWTVVGWLWATGWAALGFFAMVDRGTATTNIGSWLTPLDGFLGPNTDLWIKVIAGAMIAAGFAVWWLMDWRGRVKRERKAEQAAREAAGDRPSTEMAPERLPDSGVGILIRKAKSVSMADTYSEADHPVVIGDVDNLSMERTTAISTLRQNDGEEKEKG